jgi:hypothetical protein
MITASSRPLCPGTRNVKYFSVSESGLLKDEFSTGLIIQREDLKHEFERV